MRPRVDARVAEAILARADAVAEEVLAGTPEGVAAVVKGDVLEGTVEHGQHVAGLALEVQRGPQAEHRVAPQVRARRRGLGQELGARQAQPLAVDAAQGAVVFQGAQPRHLVVQFLERVAAVGLEGVGRVLAVPGQGLGQVVLDRAEDVAAQRQAVVGSWWVGAKKGQSRRRSTARTGEAQAPSSFSGSAISS